MLPRRPRRKQPRRLRAARQARPTAAGAAGSVEAQALTSDEVAYIVLCEPHWFIDFGSERGGYVYYTDELPRYYHLSRPEA